MLLGGGWGGGEGRGSLAVSPGHLRTIALGTISARIGRGSGAEIVSRALALGSERPRARIPLDPRGLYVSKYKRCPKHTFVALFHLKVAMF